MQRSNLIIGLLGYIFINDAIADQTTIITSDLEPIEVVANKTKESTVTKNNSESASLAKGQSVQSSGNAITPLVVANPADDIHTTQQQLNNLGGVSILGSSQTISQNISVGGLSDNNIFVGIDGVNNYFASFGHGHGDNQTRLLPDPFLFKQVEVSQTGADITYGSGNLGGAVNFVTLDPEDILKGDKLSVITGGGVNSVTNGQTANLGFAAKTGNVSYLLAGSFNNSNDTQLSNGTTLAYSANQTFQNLAKLGIDISNSQKLKLSFLQMQNQGLYPSVINGSVNEDNPSSNFTLRQSQATIDYSYSPNNPYFDIQAKLFYLNNYYQSLPTETTLEAIPQQININTAGLKLQNQTKVIGQKFLYGLEYTGISGADAYNTNTMLSFPSANQQLYGLFVQDSWDIIPEINLTVGTRYNGYASSSGEYSNSGSLFTNQIALNYNFLQDWSGYAAYTQGFSVPTIQQLYLGGVHPYEAGGEPFMIMLPNPNLKPQVGNNKTVGLNYKHKFNPEHTISFGLSGYLNDVDNYILNSYLGNIDGVTTVQNTNISKARLYGYILALNYKMPYFSVDTNFTQGYGKTMSGYLDGHGDYIAPGTPLPIPQAKGFIGLGFPIQPIDSTIKVNFNYALSQYQTLPETPGVNGYFLTGLAYTWNPKGQMKGFNVVTGVDNLFNQNYQQYDGINVYPGIARNLYLQASYRY